MKKCDFCTQSSPKGKCKFELQSSREKYCKEAIKLMCEALKRRKSSMTKKIIIKNNTSDLVDTTILCAVNKYLSDYNIKAELDIYGSTIITFSDYACYVQKLKSGTITLTFVDNVSAEQKKLTHQHEDKGE